MYKFKYVFRKTENKEKLEYKKINENVEYSDSHVESLLRSSMATIKYKEDYMELYYNV